MLEVAAALEIVLRHARRLPLAVTPLAPAVLGQVLAEGVAADLDSPPFDKSMMDGYAVRAADGGERRVVGEVAAGGSATVAVGLGEAVRIFTGAPIPAGADAVVKQEDTTTDGDVVRITSPVKPGQNIFRRGQEMKAGDVVLPAGAVLSPVALGVLAAVGQTEAMVFPRPTVGVIVTGNELVEADTRPTGGQIRNTNGPMLAGQAARAGAVSRYLGIARDDEAAMRALIADGLATSNVLLLSGGVSVGMYDLVPDVLKALGIDTHFHTVRMKPGKPLLFGTKDGTLVFGLPGNPVSGYVGFELFVKPAIDKLLGREAVSREVALPLSEPLTANHDRPTYHPAVVARDSVRPLPWSGSADLRGLLAANGFIVVPPGAVKWTAGDAVSVVLTNG
jgi:molybdopterin molybdotransferase